MIYIVHGNDVVKSKILIVNQQKKLGVESRTNLDIAQISSTILLETISSKSLFGDTQFVVFDVTNAGRTNVDEFIEILEKTPKETCTVIFAEKELTKTNAFIKNSARLNAKIIENSVSSESSIFKFLDSLFLKNRVGVYKELGKLNRENYSDLRIFPMILYALRKIASVKFDAKSAKLLKPFQKSKFQKQAFLFSGNTIKNLFESLYEIDKKAKTGETTPEAVIPSAIEKVLNS